jgi:type II secretion system protein H
MSRPKRRSGFTLLEMIVIVGILGILASALYPAIMNALRSRTLEAAARGISMELNRAKIMAVKTKTNIRVVFSQSTGQPWTFIMESQDAAGNWAAVTGVPKQFIAGDLRVTVNLPDQSIVYSPLGLVDNYTAGQNSISLSSEQIRLQHQPDVRSLNIFAGGSVQYIRSRSTEAP